MLPVSHVDNNCLHCISSLHPLHLERGRGGGQDILCWKNYSNGMFTFVFGYGLIVKSQLAAKENDIYRLIWTWPSSEHTRVIFVESTSLILIMTNH